MIGKKLWLWWVKRTTEKGEQWLLRRATDNIDDWGVSTLSDLDRVDEGYFVTEEEIKALLREGFEAGALAMTCRGSWGKTYNDKGEATPSASTQSRNAWFNDFIKERGG